VKTLNVHEAKTRLSAVLAEIERDGEVFLICRNGKPVAELSPHRSRSRLEPHPVASRIRIRYDPTEHLQPDEWAEEVGENAGGGS